MFGHSLFLIYHQLAFSLNTQSNSLAIQKNQPYVFVVSMYSTFISFRAANTAFVLSTAFSSVIFPLSKDFRISFKRFFIRRFVLESKNILSFVMRQPKNGTPKKVFPNTGTFRKSSSFSRQKRSTSSKILFNSLIESPKITISSI